ncbi:MAG: hypothetical protein V3V33_01540 [Candidatus Lokiarchaeia archaeon]
MKLQYYEMMDDKSKKYLLYLIEQVLPHFTISELQMFLEDIGIKPSNKKKTSKSKSKSSQGYVEIGMDVGNIADLSKLTEEQLKATFQIFISREKNDKLSLKWRFYQYINYKLNLNIKSIKINRDPNPDRLIDFIVYTEDKEVIFCLCYDVLELSKYNNALNKMNEFAKKQNLIPDRIIFATGKSFRNIPIDEPIKIINKELTPELWIEWIEEKSLFNKEDLLIINDSELKLAGFNFTSTDDMLNYVFKHSNGGQISVFRQKDFFTEVNEDTPEVELIWKGIMLK